MVQEVMEKTFENFLLNMCFNLNRILIKKITWRAFQILTGKTLFARKTTFCPLLIQRMNSLITSKLSVSPFLVTAYISNIIINESLDDVMSVKVHSTILQHYTTLQYTTFYFTCIIL